MSNIAVTNFYTDAVYWESAETCGFQVNDNIHTWKIDVTANLQFIEQYLTVLTPDEIARANRYLRKQDHDSFIVSRASLRFILSRYLDIHPAKICFQPGTNNKPLIASHQHKGIHFNLSDSADRIMISIAKQEIGVDIEWIKPQFYYEDILHLNFNQPEVDFILADDSLFRFFLLWTRKEALLKATGIGLTDHLRDIQSLNGEQVFDGRIISTQNNWQLYSFMADASYITTSAIPPSIKNSYYFDFNFAALIV